MVFVTVGIIYAGVHVRYSGYGSWAEIAQPMKKDARPERVRRRTILGVKEGQSWEAIRPIFTGSLFSFRFQT